MTVRCLRSWDMLRQPPVLHLAIARYCHFPFLDRILACANLHRGSTLSCETWHKSLTLHGQHVHQSAARAGVRAEINGTVMYNSVRSHRNAFKQCTLGRPNFNHHKVDCISEQAAATYSALYECRAATTLANNIDLYWDIL